MSFRAKALIVLSVVGLLAAALFVSCTSRNAAQAEALTLEWGRLAPFPETAEQLVIDAEGGMFTRTFVGSFSDTPDNVEAWLMASPGVTEGEPDGDGGYWLKTQSGFGSVTVSPDGRSVSFSVSWS